MAMAGTLDAFWGSLARRFKPEADTALLFDGFITELTRNSTLAVGVAVLALLQVIGCQQQRLQVVHHVSRYSYEKGAATEPTKDKAR